MKYIKLICIICVVFMSVEGFAQGKISRPAKKVQQTSPTKESNSSHKTNTIRVSNPDGFIAGHGYVDLGLPSGVKWATCNVGASSPSDYGNYYAWGEITTKSEYIKENSKTYEKSFDDISGNPKYDAARANWGDSWRLPTELEIRELGNECRWIETTQRGHRGFIVVGSNGMSIFLPAAGRYDSSLNLVGEYCYYWGSTPSVHNFSQTASTLFLKEYYTQGKIAWILRALGCSIRPVSY